MNHEPVKNELKLGDHRIAYTLTQGAAPCVIFFSGFKSDMTGSKAVALEAACVAKGQRFIRFDYTGHGASSGAFIDGCISDWKRDALAIIDALGGEKNIFVGSSMGAWIAALCALERKEKLAAFVGVASALDFTETLIWEKMVPAQQHDILERGVYLAPSCYGEAPYPITKKLIEDGRKHLLLGAEIALPVPVRLLHGTNDADVPYTQSIKFMEKLTSKDAKLTLIKDGDHRLSSPENLGLLCEVVMELAQTQSR